MGHELVSSGTKILEKITGYIYVLYVELILLMCNMAVFRFLKKYRFLTKLSNVSPPGSPLRTNASWSVPTATCQMPDGQKPRVGMSVLGIDRAITCDTVSRKTDNESLLKQTRVELTASKLGCTKSWSASKQKTSKSVPPEFKLPYMLFKKQYIYKRLLLSSQNWPYFPLLLLIFFYVFLFLR